MAGVGKLVGADEARRRFREVWRPQFRAQRLATADALGRVLTEGVESPEDLPPFRRALMDGFACRAAEIASVPCLLQLAGEVAMGAASAGVLPPGGALRVPTGGMLPEGADVVVPIEQAQVTPDGRQVRIEAALTAGRHMIDRGEDVTRGTLLLSAGHRLRPTDIGALMGLGIREVAVRELPVVGILSTGDEVVDAHEDPPFGKIRDMNSYALAAAVQVLGAVPRRYGVIADSMEDLLAAARKALDECDVLLFNGGTSVGEKDYVAPVVAQLGAPGILVHGVDIRPGKPTLFAVCAGKPVFGLPGQPVSALNTFEQFAAPILRELLGGPTPSPELTARLAEAVRSADGREDHVRVRLEPQGDGPPLAYPILGVSAMITTMVRADGIIVIPAGSPGIEAGAEVPVRLILQ